MAGRKVTGRWRGALPTPLGGIAAGMIVVLVALAVLAPVLFHHGATTDDVPAALQGPSAAHLLGTDTLGRDVLARVLVASRLSLEMAVLATLIAVVGGAVLGALPAVLGRRAGRLVVAAINLTIAFPGLLLAIFLTIVFGLGAKGAVLAIGVASIPGFARLTQTLTSSVAGADYMAAARLLGVRRTRIVTRHVLPNIAEPLVINVTVSVGGALLAFAGLSFLGLGVQPPSYDWGQLLNQGLSQIYTNPAASLAPGAAVVLAGLSFNLLGDAAARTLGVRTARRPRGVPVPAVPAAGPARADTPVLAAEGVQVSFPGPGGWVTPVTDVSFDVAAGETVGIVGESGSGKSLTAMAVSQLVGDPGVVAAARVAFAGRDLSAMTASAVRSLLGTSLAMVFQDPLSALNPALRVGPQLAEVARVHERMPRTAALSRAVDRLGAVRLPSPARRARQYPHELSGGMRQRAVIGMGLMVSPRLIIADEPTTALDVTVQRQVLDLLAAVRDEHGAAIVLISHDIAVVGQVCERVLVMYAGRIVEDLPASALLDDAAHPYTRALVAAVPDMSTDRTRPLATIAGRPPDPAALPPGCAFSPRCPFADELCGSQRPPLTSFGAARRVACWHPRHDAAARATGVGAGTVES